MVRSVRFFALAFLAIADVACGFYSERCVGVAARFFGREMAVSIFRIERRSGIGENGDCVGGVEEEV